MELGVAYAWARRIAPSAIRGLEKEETMLKEICITRLQSQSHAKSGPVRIYSAYHCRARRRSGIEIQATGQPSKPVY